MTARAAGAVSGLVLLLVSGCGSGSSGGAAVSTPSTVRSLDEHANGTSVDVRLGDSVVVTLHSTYWTMLPVSGPLRPRGAPQTSPSACPVTGGGCGLVTETYEAGHVGTATLRAHRDSCGEARRCTAGQGDWTVTVHVS